MRIDGNSCKWPYWITKTFSSLSYLLPSFNVIDGHVDILIAVPMASKQHFTHHSNTGRYCWERVLAMGMLSVCLSVCLSVTTRYGFKARWDRDSGSSPSDILESLVSYEVIWCHWVKRFPSNEGIKEGYPHPLEIVILPLYFTILPTIWVLSDFFAILGCDAHLEWIFAEIYWR